MSENPTKTQRVIELVRRLDAVEPESNRLAAEVAAIKHELAVLTGDSVTESVTPSVAIATAMKTIHRDGEPESHAERAYQFVRSGLPFDVGLLALSLYKEKTAAAKNKARAVLYFLEKRKRLIKRLPNGEWVPTNPEDMDGFNEAENEGPITNEH